MPVYGYRVVNAFPHDPQAYTQGLIYLDGFLFESTGRNGQSTVRKVRLETGEVVQQYRVASQYFAEGLTEWNRRLIQLTWQSNIGFVYDLSSLTPQTTFRYTGEGWGLTHDRTRLIMSDGSDSLRFLDPVSFREQGRVSVRDGSVSDQGSQRVGIRSRRDLRQRVAHGSHRPNLTGIRPSRRLD